MHLGHTEHAGLVFKVACFGFLKVRNSRSTTLPELPVFYSLLMLRWALDLWVRQLENVRCNLTRLWLGHWPSAGVTLCICPVTALYMVGLGVHGPLPMPRYIGMLSRGVLHGLLLTRLPCNGRPVGTESTVDWSFLFVCVGRFRYMDFR